MTYIKMIYDRENNILCLKSFGYESSTMKIKVWGVLSFCIKFFPWLGCKLVRKSPRDAIKVPYSDMYD